MGDIHYYDSCRDSSNVCFYERFSHNKFSLHNILSISSRSRIPAGSGFVIGVKINSAEFQQGGLEQNDVIAIAEHLDVSLNTLLFYAN